MSSSAQGDLAGALKRYKKKKEIISRLARTDPDNAGWQRDLSVSYNKIGDVQKSQGDLAAALESFKASHDIFERLARADPNNAGWQRDLSVSHNKIGDVQKAQGDLGQALKSYQADLAIAERLARADPQNAGWQRDLAWSYWRLAKYGGDPKKNWQKVVDILRDMTAKGTLAPSEQKWLPIAEKNLAAALEKQ